MAKTLLQLKTEIRGQIWAAGEAENLVSAHDDHFQEALADIALWVDCEQGHNVNATDFCKSFFKCGLTVVPAPQGIIQRVYTIANNDYCDPVFYRQKSYGELLAWAQQLVYIVQANTAAKLPLGFSPSDASTDAATGRARQGYWALYNGNLYLGPWLQSMESVVVEWDGVKEAWQEQDLVSANQQYRKAVKLFVQFAHERDFGSAERAAQFKVGTPPGTGGYDQALADLMWKCREETKVRPDQPVLGNPNSGWLAPLWLEKGLPPGPTPPNIFVHLGNFAGESQDMNNVGALVRQMGPQVILGAGFITGTGPDRYDDSVGAWFVDFLEPYIGVHGAGAEGGNAFWPAPTQADFVLDQCASWKAFFPTGNKTHYTQCFGDVQFFFVSSSVLEPDGNWPNSAQAKLLQVQLAMSTAPWKVVVLSDCAYGSVRNNPLLQWPFKSWGVNLVLSSGAVNYERLNVSGLAVINNGLGGGFAVEPVVTPDPNLVFAYATQRGAGRITVAEAFLQYDFVAVDGTLIDTLILGTPPAQSASATGSQVSSPGTGSGGAQPFQSTGPALSSTRSHGNGPPSPSLGQPGDTYVDDTTGALYWKSAAGWKP